MVVAVSAAKPDALQWAERLREQSVALLMERDGDTIAALLESQHALIESQRRALEAARDALASIERWQSEFPDTGLKWDDGTPMSYSAAFGSNGERDFMRAKARVALAQVRAVLGNKTEDANG
jgi:hypothetical protein